MGNKATLPWSKRALGLAKEPHADRPNSDSDSFKSAEAQTRPGSPDFKPLSQEAKGLQPVGPMEEAGPSAAPATSLDAGGDSGASKAPPPVEAVLLEPQPPVAAIEGAEGAGFEERIPAVVVGGGPSLAVARESPAKPQGQASLKEAAAETLPASAEAPAPPPITTVTTVFYSDSVPGMSSGRSPAAPSGHGKGSDPSLPGGGRKKPSLLARLSPFRLFRSLRAKLQRAAPRKSQAGMSSRRTGALTPHSVAKASSTAGGAGGAAWLHEGLSTGSQPVSSAALTAALRRSVDIRLEPVSVLRPGPAPAAAESKGKEAAEEDGRTRTLSDKALTLSDTGAAPPVAQAPAAQMVSEGEARPSESSVRASLPPAAAAALPVALQQRRHPDIPPTPASTPVLPYAAAAGSARAGTRTRAQAAAAAPAAPEVVPPPGGFAPMRSNRWTGVPAIETPGDDRGAGGAQSDIPAGLVPPSGMSDGALSRAYSRVSRTQPTPRAVVARRHPHLPILSIPSPQSDLSLLSTPPSPRGTTTEGRRFSALSGLSGFESIPEAGAGGGAEAEIEGSGGAARVAAAPAPLAEIGRAFSRQRGLVPRTVTGQGGAGRGLHPLPPVPVPAAPAGQGLEDGGSVSDSEAWGEPWAEPRDHTGPELRPGLGNLPPHQLLSRTHTRQREGAAAAALLLGAAPSAARGASRRFMPAAVSDTELPRSLRTLAALQVEGGPPSDLAPVPASLLEEFSSVEEATARGGNPARAPPMSRAFSRQMAIISGSRHYGGNKALRSSITTPAGEAGSAAAGAAGSQPMRVSSSRVLVSLLPGGLAISPMPLSGNRVAASIVGPGVASGDAESVTIAAPPPIGRALSRQKGLYEGTERPVTFRGPGTGVGASERLPSLRVPGNVPWNPLGTTSSLLPSLSDSAPPPGPMSDPAAPPSLGDLGPSRSLRSRPGGSIFRMPKAQAALTEGAAPAEAAAAWLVEGGEAEAEAVEGRTPAGVVSSPARGQASPLVRGRSLRRGDTLTRGAPMGLASVPESDRATLAAAAGLGLGMGLRGPRDARQPMSSSQAIAIPATVLDYEGTALPGEQGAQAYQGTVATFTAAAGLGVGLGAGMGVRGPRDSRQPMSSSQAIAVPATALEYEEAALPGEQGAAATGGARRPLSDRKVGLASSGASRFFPRATVDAVELSPAGLELSAMGYVSDSASDTRVRRRHTPLESALVKRATAAGGAGGALRVPAAVYVPSPLPRSQGMSDIRVSDATLTQTSSRQVRRPLSGYPAGKSEEIARAWTAFSPATPIVLGAASGAGLAAGGDRLRRRSLGSRPMSDQSFLGAGADGFEGAAGSDSRSPLRTARRQLQYEDGLAGGGTIAPWATIDGGAGAGLSGGGGGRRQGLGRLSGAPGWARGEPEAFSPLRHRRTASLPSPDSFVPEPIIGTVDTGSARSRRSLSPLRFQAFVSPLRSNRAESLPSPDSFLPHPLVGAATAASAGTGPGLSPLRYEALGLAGGAAGDLTAVESPLGPGPPVADNLVRESRASFSPLHYRAPSEGAVQITQADTVVQGVAAASLAPEAGLSPLTYQAPSLEATTIGTTDTAPQRPPWAALAAGSAAVVVGGTLAAQQPRSESRLPPVPVPDAEAHPAFHPLLRGSTAPPGYASDLLGRGRGRAAARSHPDLWRLQLQGPLTLAKPGEDDVRLRVADTFVDVGQSGALRRTRSVEDLGRVTAPLSSLGGAPLRRFASMGGLEGTGQGTPALMALTSYRPQGGSALGEESLSRIYNSAGQEVELGPGEGGQLEPQPFGAAARRGAAARNVGRGSLYLGSAGLLFGLATGAMTAAAVSDAGHYHPSQVQGLDEAARQPGYSLDAGVGPGQGYGYLAQGPREPFKILSIRDPLVASGVVPAGALGPHRVTLRALEGEGLARVEGEGLEGAQGFREPGPGGPSTALPVLRASWADKYQPLARSQSESALHLGPTGALQLAPLTSLETHEVHQVPEGGRVPATLVGHGPGQTMLSDKGVYYRHGHRRIRPIWVAPVALGAAAGGAAGGAAAAAVGEAGSGAGGAAAEYDVGQGAAAPGQEFEFQPNEVLGTQEGALDRAAAGVAAPPGATGQRRRSLVLPGVVSPRPLQSQQTKVASMPEDFSDALSDTIEENFRKQQVLTAKNLQDKLRLQDIQHRASLLQELGRRKQEEHREMVHSLQFRLAELERTVQQVERGRRGREPAGVAVAPAAPAAL